MCYRLGFSKDVGELGLTGIESRKRLSFIYVNSFTWKNSLFVTWRNSLSLTWENENSILVREFWFLVLKFG